MVEIVHVICERAGTAAPCMRLSRGCGCTSYTDLELRKIVYEALDNAYTNGFRMLDCSDAFIARDLVQFDADLEKIKPENLIPHIAKYRENHHGTGTIAGELSA